MSNKPFLLIIAAIVISILPDVTRASQADDTTITITGQTAGPTPFISQLTLAVSDISVLSSI